MLTNVQTNPPRRRPNLSAPVVSPVLPMTLLSAIYQSQTAVRLTFDQPIDTSTVSADGFNVFDGDAQQQFVGTSFSLVNANTIAIELILVGEYLGGGITLNADASNGIKSVSGEVWDGVEGLALPFQ